MRKKSQNKIVENNSPLFQEGFFVALTAKDKEKYNCATCLTVLKERGYSINSASGQEFVAGWKFLD